MGFSGGISPFPINIYIKLISTQNKLFAHITRISTSTTNTHDTAPTRHNLRKPTRHQHGI
jgi:hypothetical protein